MFRIAQKLAGQSDVDPFSSPWLSAWRATSWFLKRIPEEMRGGLTLEALRQTEALSVASILIHLNDPADQKEEDDFDPALSLDTVTEMKTEWLRLIRSRAANGNALVAEPDLLRQLYRWRDYSGSLAEPREWIAEAIRTDEGFASMATRMMSQGTSHSGGDRVATSHNSFNKETIDDFIGIDVAQTRCGAINPAEFPEHEEALRTLRRSLGL
jgi:hypothetical protein